MGCRVPHDTPGELHGLGPRPEFHALAMPREVRGEIEHALLESHRLPGMRLLRIYVPAPALRGDQPLPVLLVNDGHKAFEAANHARVAPWQQAGTLQLHRLMDGLLCQGAVPPAVVVAIATHASTRADHYVPVRTRLGEVQFGGHGEAYLDLLEHDLLPLLHRRLVGLPLREDAGGRVLMGFSIGGVAALHGALTRPQVWGNALALSPSAWVDDGYLTRLARDRGAVPVRIAADVGDGEKPPIREHCRQLFAVLAETCGARALVGEVPGTHHEDSWRERLPRLLQHVLA